MQKDVLHRAADELTALLKAHVSDNPEEIDVHEAIAARDDLREIAYDLSEERSHTFEVGDHAVDKNEPMPSVEQNTVEIIGLSDQRADELVISGLGKTVAEYETNSSYPDDDLIVVGRYPNIDGDREWNFPESRLRKL